MLRYGLDASIGGVGRNVHLHVVSPWIMVTTLARFFSFAGFEVSRFVGTDGAKRIELFQRHLWLVPAAAIVWLTGLVQPVWMAVDSLRPSGIWPDPATRPQWNALRGLVAISVLLVYASYWFVMEPPQAHAFYVLAPVAFMFAAYWFHIIDSRRKREPRQHGCSRSASSFIPGWPWPGSTRIRCTTIAHPSRLRCR